jgi:hypothetical protein
MQANNSSNKADDPVNILDDGLCRSVCCVCSRLSALAAHLTAPLYGRNSGCDTMPNGARTRFVMYKGFDEAK